MVELFSKNYNVIGMIGVILILISYFLLNINKLTAKQPIYPFMNMCGSSLILFSLMFDWNLSSVIIEIAWLSISLFGLYRTLKSRFVNKK